MGLRRKACLYGIILFAIVVSSLAGGCICGPSSSGHPSASDNNRSADAVELRADTGAIDNLSDAGSLVTPTPAPTSTPRPSAFTIYAEGGKDHRPGETLRFYGMDTCSDIVYLFISGTKTPICGGCLENLLMPVVDRDATTFTPVNVSEDGSWEYFWTAPPGQPALMFDLYNVIAAAEPRDKPHLDEVGNWDMVTVKINKYQT